MTKARFIYLLLVASMFAYALAALREAATASLTAEACSTKHDPRRPPCQRARRLARSIRRPLQAPASGTSPLTEPARSITT